MEMDLLSITRTAAMIYAEENLGNRKTETIRRKFVESIFVLRENKSMTIMTIIDALEEELSITYSEQEVLTLIKENDSFEYIAGKTKEEDMYRLTGKRYVLLQDRSSDVIQNTFEKFLGDKEKVDDFCQDMSQVFTQKCKMGLVTGLNENQYDVKISPNNPEVIFIFANHDPASKILPTLIEEIEPDKYQFPIMIARASNMGYGLYVEHLRQVKKNK